MRARSIIIHGAAATVFASAVACVGRIGGWEEKPGRDTDPSIPSPDVVSTTGLRRLSIFEYDNSVRDLLGDHTRPAASYLPEDARTPFDNDYSTQVPSGALIDGAESLAIDIAGRLMADPARRDAVVGCSPAAPDDAACMESFVRSFGRRALRRPLTDDEVIAYASLQSFAVTAADFYVGIETALWAFLQDPAFLYRVELGRPASDGSGLLRLDNFELVTRLSYLLWSSAPDDALLDAAADAETAGRDMTPEETRALASQMIRDPRARDAVERFHALWLGYETLPHDAQLTADMQQETAALINRVVFDEPQPYSQLFLATDTFVTPSLASHYGLPAPDSLEGGWVPYGESGRGGILSHGTFLSNGGKFEDTSPVRRGLAVRTRLFCQTIPPPPPDVNVDDALVSESPCKWDRYLSTLQPGCVGCHGQMNPAGWGLEEYDRAGRFRTTDDAGCELAPHATGEIGDVGTFRGPGELGELVATAGELEDCLTTQLVRLALGRSELLPEDVALAGVLVDGASGAVRLDELLLDLASSPAYAFRKLEEE